MGIFTKISVLLQAHANSILDEQIDENSVPVLKVYIGKLEVAINDAKHQAAVAAANVTTLTNQANALQTNIDTLTARAKAFLAKNNEADARICAGQIHDFGEEMKSLQNQITDAKNNSTELDGAVAKLNAKHSEMMSKFRLLSSRSQSAHSLEASTAALKSANSAMGGIQGAGIDNMEQRINARSDVAREEFNRTVAEMTPPPDPLKDQAVDDILASLKG